MTRRKVRERIEKVEIVSESEGRPARRIFSMLFQTATWHRGYTEGGVHLEGNCARRAEIRREGEEKGRDKRAIRTVGVSMVAPRLRVSLGEIVLFAHLLD